MFQFKILTIKASLVPSNPYPPTHKGEAHRPWYVVVMCHWILELYINQDPLISLECKQPVAYRPSLDRKNLGS